MAWSQQKKIADSLIGSGVSVTGKIHYSGNLYVYGTVEGDIEAGEQARHLIIGATGLITGTIHAVSLMIQGRVEGDIVCRDLLEVQDTGVLEGNITYAKVLLREGAQINGRMIQRDAPLAISGPDAKAAATDDQGNSED